MPPVGVALGHPVGNQHPVRVEPPPFGEDVEGRPAVVVRCRKSGGADASCQQLKLLVALASAGCSTEQAGQPDIGQPESRTVVEKESDSGVVPALDGP